MNKRHWSAVSGLAVGALVVTGLTAPMQAQATPSSTGPGQRRPRRSPGLPARQPAEPARRGPGRGDARTPSPSSLKGEATTKTINGNRVIEVKTTAKDKNGKPATKSKYVNYPVDREEDIFTILTDFGTQTKRRPVGAAGPVHNQIAAPDRVWDKSATDDNSTYWVPDFNRDHSVDMMFGAGDSFRDFYLKQSNGRFLAKGDVSDWVTVPYNEARYGSQPGQVTAASPTATGTTSRTRRPPGSTRRRPPARPTRRSRPTSRSSTRSTATTTTATATSPSPTATSTTSRRSTPARARRPAAAPRAPTPSGRTAGTPTPPAGKTGPGFNKLRWRPARQLRHLDR